MPAEAEIYVNGINAETGEYMLGPMTIEQVMPYITGERRETKVLRWLRKIWGGFKSFHLGEERDWTNLAEAGWGVVFREGESEAIKTALEPLYEHRRAQVSHGRATVEDLRHAHGTADCSQCIHEYSSVCLLHGGWRPGTECGHSGRRSAPQPRPAQARRCRRRPSPSRPARPPRCPTGPGIARPPMPRRTRLPYAPCVRSADAA